MNFETIFTQKLLTHNYNETASNCWNSISSHLCFIYHCVKKQCGEQNRHGQCFVLFCLMINEYTGIKIGL